MFDWKKKKVMFGCLVAGLCLTVTACKHNLFTMKYKETVEDTTENLSEKVKKTKKEAIQGKEIVEIYVMTPSYENPFFKAEAESITKKIKEYGYQVRVVSHIDDVVQQEDLFQEAVEEGAAAIICDNANSHLTAEAIAEAKKSGTATILIDRGIEEKNVAFAQILSDNVQGATLVAEQFAKEMQEEGSYIELLGMESDENAALRSEAFHAYLDSKKKMKMVAQERANWSREEAKKITAWLLEKEREIKGILCGNDTMALGALDAVKDAELDHEVIITGIDGSDDVRDEILKGNIKATVLQPVDQIAELAAEQIHRYLTEKKQVETEIQKIPCVLITKENAGQIAEFEYFESVQ